MAPFGALVDSASGAWCKLGTHDGHALFGLTRAGPRGLALSGTDDGRKNTLHLFDRTAWNIFEVDLSRIHLVAGDTDDLYVGGWIGGPSDRARGFLRHRYATATWEPLDVTDMPFADFTRTSSDGILAWHPPSGSGARYRFASGSWEPLPAKGWPGSGRLMFAVSTGEQTVIVMNGGKTAPGTDLTAVFASGTWRGVRTPFDAMSFAGAVDSEGNVYYAGGERHPEGWLTVALYRLTPGAGAWSELLSLPGSACDVLPEAMGWHRGKLYLFSADGGACAVDVTSGVGGAVASVPLAPGWSTHLMYLWLDEVMLALRSDYEPRRSGPVDPLIGPTTALLYHPPGTRLSPGCR